MFLDNLEKLMNARNLNKHSFSQQSGIPYKTIDNFWKKGCDNVKLTTLKKIAEFFGVTLDYLIFGSGGISNDINVSIEEKKLITAYRAHSEMQPAIKKMLDIDVEPQKSYSSKIINVGKAAAFGGEAKTVNITTSEQAKIDRIMIDMEENE